MSWASAYNGGFAVVYEDGVYSVVKESESEPVEPGDDGTEVTKNEDGSVTIEENKTNPGTASIMLNDTETTIKVTSTIDTLTIAGETPAEGQIVVLSSNGTDITAACKMTTTAGTIDLSLDGTKSVKIGEETIPVTPTMTEAASSEGTIADGAVATKAIPGLTYTLVRDSDVGGTFETTADSETAAATTVTLKDETGTKPTDKAFYKIQVSK